MKLSFVDLSRTIAPPAGRPPAISLIREATRSGLEARGIHGAPPAEAQLTLVDVLDDGTDPDPDGQRLAELDACQGPLIVRVHACPGAHEPSAGLAGLLDRADGVLLATRSHLVRLGSAGLLEASRTDLIAPVAPELSPSPEGAQGSGVLVLGEQLPQPLDQAVAGLALGCSQLGPDAQDAGSGMRLQRLVEQHAMVVMTEIELAEDGVIAAVCGQLGRPLVAPGGVDLASQAHCFAVGASASRTEWAEALVAARGAVLSASPSPSTGSGLMDRLARILSRATRRPDCPRTSAA